MEKQCSKCKLVLNVEMFSLEKRNRRDPYRSWCKKCRVKSQRDYNKTDAGKKSKQNRYKKKYWLSNKAKEYGKEYRKTDKYKKYQRKYQQKYEIEHVEKLKEKRLQFKLSGKKKIYTDFRYKNDIQYKLAVLLRTRLTCAMRLNKRTKAGSSIRDLGCTIPELKIHLENQFKDGMTWENHSPTGWHIDHKKGLVNFDLTNRKQFLKACHYTNLQPMWAKENLSKVKYLSPENNQCELILPAHPESLKPKSLA